MIKMKENAHRPLLLRAAYRCLTAKVYSPVEVYHPSEQEHILLQTTRLWPCNICGYPGM